MELAEVGVFAYIVSETTALAGNGCEHRFRPDLYQWGILKLMTDDMPVFDVANDNRAYKKPDSFFDKPEVDKDDTPTGIAPIRTPSSKASARERRKAESAAMQLARAAIASRTAHCDKAWNGAANDNEAWPLLTALKREGDNDSVDTVLRYRQLVALCECEPLQGQRVGGGDLSAARRQNNLEAESDAAIAKAREDNWKITQLPGGEIRYKEVKKRKGGTFHLPALHAVTTNDETRVRTAPIAMPFNCDLLIRQIDAKPVLAKIRAGLGPLVDPFEDAVLGGRTYTQIGKADGIDVKPDVAGKALVKRAIIAVEGMMEDIRKRRQKAEREAEHRASLRRCQIAVEKARYFGKAA